MGWYCWGWERRIGVLTLLMACMFMAGWIRSFNYTDGTCGAVFRRYHVIESDAGNLTWFSCDSGDHWQKTDYWTFEYTPINEVHFPNVGFALVALQGDNRRRWSVDYWTITIPLTVVSLCLFLFSSRDSTEKKIMEPTANERA